MARALFVLALVAIVATAAFAQQNVQCTYNLSGFTSRNRFVSAGGAVSTTVPTTFTNRPTANGSGCWQLDGFASVAPALDAGEQPSPASPFIQLDRTGPTQTKATSVCSTNNSIYGNVRELSISGTPNSCTLTGEVFSRPTDNGQGRLSIGSDSGCDYTARYRLDGSGTCPGTAVTQSFNLATASGKSLNQLGDAFEVTIGTDGGSVPNVVVTIDVYGTSAAEKTSISFIIEKNTNTLDQARNYVIPFSSFSGSANAFSNTGAIEISFGGADVDALLVFFDVIQAPVTTVGATVFVDCGCNGFVQGSGDSLQAGVAVQLQVSGAGCTASTTSQTTSSSGTVSFGSLPSGCTYTLSVAGQNLCSNTASSQAVGAGGSASFAIQGAAGSLVIPADRTVNCGGDTSPAATGTATGGGGACGATGTPTFTDAVSPQTCTAPGGTLSIIRRTWTLGGSNQVQTITVVDTRQITLSGVPTGTTLTCNQAVPTAQVSGVACTAVTVVPTTSNAAGTCDVNTCSQSSSTTVTYTGTDVCKNTVSRVVTYQRTGCAATCPTVPTPVPVPNTPPPPPATQLPTNANCRFICDDDDSSAVSMIASLVVVVVLALAAAF